MATLRYTLFETPIGFCGLVWGEDGILAARLPEAEAERVRSRIARRFPEAIEAEPPPEIARTITAILALLSGEAADLTGVALDMAAIEPFNRKVYDAARAIPPGETRTYGEIAAAIGEPRATREVGRALGENPFPPIVPCHRVLAAGGATGGFSAPGGVVTKMKMLEIERARSPGPPGLFDDLPLAVRPRR